LHAKDYRLVIFEDLNDGSKILVRSTVRTDETAKYTDGKEYPIVKVHISSSSHPFFTGQEKVLDLEGRVDRFKARAEAAAKAKAAKLAKAEKTVKAKTPAKQSSGKAEITD
jgi:large subunit ribosomal protein L31